MAEAAAGCQMLVHIYAMVTPVERKVKVTHYNRRKPGNGRKEGQQA